MKYLNKVKMINSVYGNLENCYRSKLIDYAHLDKINFFIENIVSKEDMIYPRYVKFLMRQELIIARFIYCKLKKKSSYTKINFNCIDSYLYRN